MSFYNSVSKEAVLYHSYLMAGSWGYKPTTYAIRMGWLHNRLKVTEKGHKLAIWKANRCKL